MPDLPFDPDAERAFVRAVLDDQEQAIKKLAERIRCVPRILTARNARMGFPLDEHDLADLAQDTILIILRKLDDYAGRAPFEAWVYRVCCLELMNGIRRKHRSRSRLRDTDGAVLETLASPPPQDLIEQDLVHRALERLGGVEAETIRLKHFDGLTFEEIGRALEVPTNSAKTRYYRGLTKLEQYLQGKEGIGRTA